MNKWPLPPTPHRLAQAPDPHEIAKSFAQIAERSQKLVNDYLERHAHGSAPAVSDDLGLTHAFMDLGAALMANPWKLAEAQMRMWHDYLRLWHSSMQRFLGEKPAPVAEPAKSDNRFKSELWQNNFLFDYIKQSYLIARGQHPEDRRRGPGPGPADRAQGAVLHAPVRRCAGADQLRVHQPGGAEGHGRNAAART